MVYTPRLYSIQRIGGRWCRDIRESSAAPSRVPQPFFGLHPFIEANPKAVFIRRTNVPDKMHEESKRREGLTLAREIFVPRQQGGIPVSHRIILKPNVCSVREQGSSARGELGHRH